MDDIIAYFAINCYPLLPWCRGHHVCLTRKRSTVQFCLEAYFENIYVVGFSARGLRDMFGIPSSRLGMSVISRSPLKVLTRSVYSDAANVSELAEL